MSIVTALWDFSEPGAAGFGNTRFRVTCSARRLLAALVRRPGVAVADTWLMSAIGNAYMHRDTLRSHVRTLRQVLRQHLPAAQIVRVDRWPNAGYRLILSEES
jgi:DNA-binding response OmpR family regulator